MTDAPPGELDTQIAFLTVSLIRLIRMHEVGADKAMLTVEVELMDGTIESWLLNLERVSEVH